MSDIIFEKIAAIFFSILILLLAWLSARLYKNWLLPSVIFSVFWFLLSFIPLVAAFDVPVNAYAILYVFLANLFFMLPVFFFDWKAAKNSFINRNIKSNDFFLLNSSFIRTSFIFSQVFVMCSIFLDIFLQGFSLTDVLFNLLQTASSYIALRYSDSLESSIIIRIGTVFMYVGSILGGVVFCFTHKKNKKLFVLLFSLLPSLLVMTVQGAKGALFLCMFLFYGAVVIGRLYDFKFTLTDRYTNKYLIIGILCVLPVIIVSFLSRGLYEHDNSYIIKKLVFYFNSYAFSHLYAFSDWFNAKLGYESVNDYADLTDVKYGFFTFMSIFRVFGDTQSVPAGYYDEYYYYKDVLQSNIYTIYRGLILDFGIVGSLIFMSISGYFVNLIFYLVLKLKKPLTLIILYCCMFGYFYSSMIISLLVWNSMYVTFLVLAMIFFISKFRGKGFEKTGIYSNEL